MEIIALTIALGMFAKYLEYKLDSTFAEEKPDFRSNSEPKSIYDKYAIA